MPIRDLGDLLHPDLEYPGVKSTKHPTGKTYTVPSPDSKEGLRLTALANLGLNAAAGGQLSAEDAAAVRLDDDGEKDLYKRVLTATVYDEMLDDGVPWLTLKAIAEDALVYFGTSAEMANLALDIRRSGEALARANRATKRAAKKAATRRTSSGSTPRKRGGSKSSQASGGTPARTRARTSTPSSNETPTMPETATA